MHRNRLIAALVAALTPIASAKSLKVGDAAPPLKIASWLKGNSVDVTKGPADQIYVVEFWATWCPPCRMSIPHLSELQTHFKDKKVEIIGVSAEDSDVVKTFLRTWDKKMQYAVAIDDDAKSSAAYLEAAGIPGIPHAFIVKAGKLLWHAHPMEIAD